MLRKKINTLLGLNKFFFKQDLEELVIHLCPAIATGNVGDMIIKDAVDRQLESLFPEAFVCLYPLKTPLNALTLRHYNMAKYRFVGGSNILDGQWRPLQPNWAVSLLSAWKYRSAILLGAGWRRYQTGNIPFIVRKRLDFLLDKNMLHSVRDSYTQQKMQEMGFSNVLNTACPTTWGLTGEFCRTIPRAKSNAAVVTISDYAKKPERDCILFNTCLSLYKEVFFFPQSPNDISYFRTLAPQIEQHARIRVIPVNLKAYDNLLSETRPDFIGTRLHGGIRALQHGCRALIAGIDNRAAEMGSDINLPILSTDDLRTALKDKIINGWDIDIKIPEENIRIWREQFINPGVRD